MDQSQKAKWVEEFFLLDDFQLLRAQLYCGLYFLVQVQDKSYLLLFL